MKQTGCHPLILLLAAVILSSACVGVGVAETMVAKDGPVTDYKPIPNSETLQSALSRDENLAAGGQLNSTAILLDNVHGATLVGTGPSPLISRPPLIPRPPPLPKPVAVIDGIPVYNRERESQSPFLFTPQEITVMSNVLASIPPTDYQGIHEILSEPQPADGTGPLYQFTSEGTLIINLPSLAFRVNPPGQENSLTFATIESALTYAAGASLYRSPTLLAPDVQAQIVQDAAQENSLVPTVQATPESLFASTFAGWLGAGGYPGNSISVLYNGLLSASQTGGHSPALSEALIEASLFASPQSQTLIAFSLDLNSGTLTTQPIPFTSSNTSLLFNTPSGPLKLVLNGNQVVGVSDILNDPNVTLPLANPISLPPSALKAFGR